MSAGRNRRGKCEVYPGSVVTYNNLSTIVRSNFDFDAKFVVFSRSCIKLLFLIEKTLNSVIYELGESKPRFIVQMLEYLQH